MKCRCVGIGRRPRLKIVCLWRVGSSPTTGTIINEKTGGVNDMKKMKNALCSSIGTPVSIFPDTIVSNFNE